MQGVPRVPNNYGFQHSNVTTACFKSEKINAIILAILSDNLIEGMIIAVVITTELKQFQINCHNCNDHICKQVFVFPRSNHHLYQYPHTVIPCTFLVSCSRRLLSNCSVVLSSKCILRYILSSLLNLLWRSTIHCGICGFGKAKRCSQKHIIMSNTKQHNGERER